MRPLLITQIYSGSVDAGGNRAHRSIMMHIKEKYNAGAMVLDFSNCSDVADNDLSVKLRGVYDIFRHRKKIGIILKCNKVIVCDGIVSLFAVFVSSPSVLLRKRIVAIHHNNESNLKRGYFSRAVFVFIQKAFIRLADFNIFFSDVDARGLCSNERYIVCLPILARQAEHYFSLRASGNCFRAVDDIAGENYYAIPSNFSYGPNLDGLLVFYRHHRAKFGGSRVIISSPALGEVSSELLRLIEFNSDAIISIDAHESYMLFLRDADAVILPIYNGSGIQLKAIDSLFMNDKVYSSDFIRRSHGAFSGFFEFEGGSIKESSGWQFQESNTHSPRRGLVYIDQAIDFALSVVSD